MYITELYTFKPTMIVIQLLDKITSFVYIRIYAYS